MQEFLSIVDRNIAVRVRCESAAIDESDWSPVLCASVPLVDSPFAWVVSSTKNFKIHTSITT